MSSEKLKEFDVVISEQLAKTIRNTRSKAVSVQLDEVLSFFKKKSKARE